MNQARDRSRVINPMNNLPATEQLWQGVVRDVSSQDLTLAGLLLIVHKHVKNVLRDRGRGVQVLARVGVINHSTQRAYTLLPSSIRPHNERALLINTKRHLTRWHVAKEGNKEPPCSASTQCPPQASPDAGK